MTRRQWYNLFPEPYRTQALEQRNPKYLDQICKSMSDVFSVNPVTYFPFLYANETWIYWYSFKTEHINFTPSDFISKYHRIEAECFVIPLNERLTNTEYLEPVPIINMKQYSEKVWAILKIKHTTEPLEERVARKIVYSK